MTPMQQYNTAKMKVGSLEADVAKMTRLIIATEERTGVLPTKKIVELERLKKQLNNAKAFLKFIKKEVGMS